jgi:hypothetical protein
MERSVEILAIILFGVPGLSHILQPEAWAEFFILLRSKGEAGAGSIERSWEFQVAAPASWCSPALLATASTPASPTHSSESEQAVDLHDEPAVLQRRAAAAERQRVAPFGVDHEELAAGLIFPAEP